MPNNIDQIISVFKTSWDNSCPPLNPIANNKYKITDQNEIILGSTNTFICDEVGKVHDRSMFP